MKQKTSALTILDACKKLPPMGEGQRLALDVSVYRANRVSTARKVTSQHPFSRLGLPFSGVGPASMRHPTIIRYGGRFKG